MKENVNIYPHFLLNGERWTVRLFRRVKKIIKVVSFGKADIFCMYFLEMDLKDKMVSGRGVGECRLGCTEDIENDPLLRKKSIEYKNRLSRGDRFHVCVYKGNIIGFGWVCIKPVFHESRFSYDIAIPSDTAYSFNTYILERYRGLGVWTKLKEYQWNMLKSEMRSRVICYIYTDNHQSMTAHIRYGFRPFMIMFVLKVFRWSLKFKKRISQ